MQMIHSSQSFEPDLTTGPGVAQMEQNWPGAGATDAELAAWARLYGVACLDLAADALGSDDALEAEFAAALEAEFVAGAASRDDEVETLEKRVHDLKDRIMELKEDGGYRDCAAAVAAALEDAAKRGPLTAGDMRILADRLRKGF